MARRQSKITQQTEALSLVDSSLSAATFVPQSLSLTQLLIL